MKPVKGKKPVSFKRDRPDLPAEFEAAEPADRLFEDSALVTIAETRVRELERRDLMVDSFRIEGSVLEGVQLAGGKFGSTLWKDVRLVGCDLANIHSHRTTLVRVELIDCRLSGFRAAALDWQDVLIQNGDMRYSQFPGGKFRACEFEGCNWQDVDLQEADLRGSVFRSCNMGRADLRRAKLQNTDFRKSEVEEMTVEVSDLEGAIVEPVQAMILARLMGLQIVG